MTRGRKPMPIRSSTSGFSSGDAAKRIFHNEQQYIVPRFQKPIRVHSFIL